MILNFMKTLLILNPKSGRGKALSDLKSIKELLKDNRELTVYVTKGEGDAKELSGYLKNKPDLIIVCGGDGTLNLVLNVFSLQENKPKFIFLPYGTVNIFAKDNNYPKNRLKALKMILNKGQEKTLYPVLCGNKSFLLMFSAGFDSYLVKKIENKKRSLKTISYFLAFFKHAFRYNFKKSYSVLAGEEKFEGNFVLISKCKRYGGFLKFTPKASFFRENFDVMVFKGGNFFLLIVLMLKTFFSLNIKWNRLQVFKANKITLSGDGFSQIDGEKGPDLPIQISLGRGVSFVLP